MTSRLILILLVFTCAAFGQQVEADTIIIRTAIKEFGNQSITYLDNSGRMGNIKKLLAETEFTNRLDASTLVLTRTEREHLLKQDKEFKEYQWPDELLKGSRKIAVDSIWTYLKAAKPDSGHAWVFGFSKPLFFRQNTLCFFGYMARCGEDCGHTESAVYRKEGDIWKEWIIVSEGAW